MGGSQRDRAAGDLDVVLEHLYSLTERDDPRIGEVIDGRYQLVRALGSGGMGQVYVARHEALGRDVAVKILPVSGASAYREERFRREALAAARLSSPHVVSVFDFVTLPAGGLAIVMELLEGEDLAACLDREGPPPIDRALHVMRSVAEALDHAHSRGVVHRDLKPENVFLARDERGVLVVKVLDFGVARMLEPGTTSSDHALTEAGTALGTPAYMAPEQAMGDVRRVGPASDRYALAVVATEMLTGELPHPALPSPLKMLRAIVETPPRLPSRLGLDVPGLDDVFARALAADPSERHASASELVDAIEALLASPEDVEGPRLSSRPPVRSLIRVRGARAEPYRRRAPPVAGADDATTQDAATLDSPAPSFETIASSEPVSSFEPVASFEPAAVSPLDASTLDIRRGSRRWHVAAAIAVGAAITALLALGAWMVSAH